MTTSSATTAKDIDETNLDIWFRPGKWWRPIREMRERKSQPQKATPDDGDVRAEGRSSTEQRGEGGLKDGQDGGIVRADVDGQV